MKIILVDAVFCFITEKDGKFQIFSEVHHLLETYPNRKILLTGTSDDKIEFYGLNAVPYEYFTLKHNPEKINPEYYNIMLKNFNFTKEDVIYFEHDINAVKSAQSVGINTYWYDNDKKDLACLKKFLDENL